MFGPWTDSFPSHPSRQSFDKHPLYTKGRWWIWVWNIFTCHLTCRCVRRRNCRSSGTRCNTSRMFCSDQVGCTSIWMPLQGVEISIGSHTRSGSTMINPLTCYNRCPRVILLSQWRQGLNLTQMPMELWYLTTTMNALPITTRDPIVRRWSAIGNNMKLQMVLLRWEVVMKNKTKWELSALVSSR